MPRFFRKIAWFLIKAVSVLIVLIMVGALSTWISIQVLIKKKEVLVPDLTGMSVQEANHAVGTFGLELVIDEQKKIYSDDIPADRILKQDLPAGTRLKVGRSVKVVLSLGSSSPEAPDIVGSTSQKARILLGEKGLAIGRVSRVHSRETPANVVMAQDPSPGEGVDPAKTVNILESLGPERMDYLMPDFTYQNFERVSAFFRRFNIGVRTEFRRYEGVRAGAILQTKPHPGYPLRENDVVTVFVSGSPPAATGRTDMGGEE